MGLLNNKTVMSEYLKIGKIESLDIHAIEMCFNT